MENGRSPWYISLMNVKQRIGFLDADGEKCSTAAYVVTGLNHLNQKRQFATDGVRFFYQPRNDAWFIIVDERDVPETVKLLLRK